MRWTEKTDIFLETRVVTRFLFFPISIDNLVRWLEYAQIKQIRDFSTSWQRWVWVNHSWVD